jgi:Flp pilus assembly protein CpaB
MILIVAIAVGAFAAFAVLNYVRGVEDDKNEDVDLAEVYVVSSDIERNTTGEMAKSTSIETRWIPNEFRPANAMTELSQIEGKVALSDLPANQVLVTGNFVDPQSATLSFSELLTGDMTSVALQFDQIRGMGGFLSPGDTVNMYVKYDSVDLDPTGEASTEDAAALGQIEDNLPYSEPARVLYQSVKILSVGAQLQLLPGQDPGDDAITQNNAGVIIFALPPEAASRVLSVPLSEIYLTLVPDDYEPRPIEALGVSEENLPNALFPGEDGAKLTPYGPNGYDAYIDQADAGIPNEDKASGGGKSEEDVPVGETSDGGEGSGG